MKDKKINFLIKDYKEWEEKNYKHNFLDNKYIFCKTEVKTYGLSCLDYITKIILDNDNGTIEKTLNNEKTDLTYEDLQLIERTFSQKVITEREQILDTMLNTLVNDKETIKENLLKCSTNVFIACKNHYLFLELIDKNTTDEKKNADKMRNRLYAAARGEK